MKIIRHSKIYHLFSLVTKRQQGTLKPSTMRWQISQNKGNDVCSSVEANQPLFTTKQNNLKSSKGLDSLVAAIDGERQASASRTNSKLFPTDMYRCFSLFFRFVSELPFLSLFLPSSESNQIPVLSLEKRRLYASWLVTFWWRRKHPGSTFLDCVCLLVHNFADEHKCVQELNQLHTRMN